MGGKSHNYTKELLAHIEWYSKLKGGPEDHGMYKVQKLPHTEGAILPLPQICQGCMLFPDFTNFVSNGTKASGWQSMTVLDSCNSFFVNNWQSKYVYQTLW